jgi:hypothetical protein
MKKVRTLQNHMGSQGLKTAALEGKGGKEADEYEVTDKIAKDLEEKGLVEIIGDAADEPEAKTAAAPENEKVETGLRITDNTGKEKKEIIKPTTKTK